MPEKIFTFDVTVAIFAENHIGSNNSKHITLEFKSVQLLLLDILAFVLISACLFEHMVHGCNKESSGAAAGVKHNVCSLNIQKVTEQITKVARSQDDTECLPITAGITHKFAIESSNEIFTGTAILYVVKNILLQEFSIKFQRSFAKFGINLVQTSTCTDDGKFAHQLVTLCIRADIRCFQTAFYGIVNQLSVRGCFVSEQIIRFEELIIQCKKNAGDHQRLILILQRAVGAKIFVQFRRIFQNFLCSLFNIGLFCQNITSIVFVDIGSGEGCKRLNIRELLISFPVVYIQWSDFMMLFIARNTDCKNLMEATILRNVLCVEVRSVYSIVSNIFLIGR